MLLPVSSQDLEPQDEEKTDVIQQQQNQNFNNRSGSNETSRGGGSNRGKSTFSLAFSQQQQRRRRSNESVGQSLRSYMRRMCQFQQMDWEATFYQLITLCIHPSKVYKTAYYRKQTKNRWARDDPAFAVIQVFFLLIASIGWAMVFHVSKLSSYFFFVFHAIVIEWLGFGALMATGLRWLANKYLRQRSNNQGIGDTFFVEQEVEWQYAFDIHCNSFFVCFLVIDVFQFMFVPFLVQDTFFSLVWGNTIYAIGYGLYFYITFLGYMSLPFLNRTEKLLYPVVAIGALYLSTLFLKVLFGISINVAILSASYYYH